MRRLLNAQQKILLGGLTNLLTRNLTLISYLQKQSQVLT